MPAGRRLRSRREGRGQEGRQRETEEEGKHEERRVELRLHQQAPFEFCAWDTSCARWETYDSTMSHRKDMPATRPMRSSGGVKRKFAKWKKVHMLQ
mmetsp:Transcript_103540/g.273736  ORF Transcript_103540/g.273736 Transcript_103540/m.273736 type:complete len:96 (-) Transcript_103540:404-691(-)